jgi:hypothetical protein
MQEQSGDKPLGGPPADKYRTAITITSREEAKALVRDRGLDLVQTEVLEEGKRFRLIFFLNLEEVEQLRADKFQPEVGENVSELGLKRQTEVAQGDRFDGGRIAPKGLGVKRSREQEGPK